MTGEELFELLKKSKTYYEYRAHKKDDYPQGGWITLTLNNLATFIDEYFLPRPLFEDGTPVKVGDRFLLCGRNSMKVTVFYVLDDGSFSINGFQYNKYQRVMKPEEKPDSWEQLEEDSKLGSRHYCDRRKIIREGRDSLLLQKQDIIRRAKELAKGDSE